MESSILDSAERNVSEILAHAVMHGPDDPAVVVYDRQSDLSIGLAEAYKRCLPKANVLDYDTIDSNQILDRFKELTGGDLVVLIQTTRFRMDDFRLRIELFRRDLKVIEHPHLGRMTESAVETYVDSLAYDPNYFRGVGRALAQRIDQAKKGVIEGDGEKLVFGDGFEKAMLNVGDYAKMKNVGGQYPIGEVVTEAKCLEDLNGRVRIHAFGNRDFQVDQPPVPITLVIEKGRIIGTEDSTPEFDLVLANIRADEHGEVLVREFGMGLNRAFTRERIVADIGSYERMCGVHLSMGAKHHVYKKPGIKKKHVRHHVDVFVVADALSFDGEVVYSGGSWTVGQG